MKLKNKFEQKIDRQLKKAGVSYAYEGEKLPYYFTGHYIPDFVVVTPRGKIYIEAKGYFRPEHKRKMAAIRKLYPFLDIRIVFYSLNKKNTRWAEKYNFTYAIGQIPKEWLI